MWWTHALTLNHKVAWWINYQTVIERCVGAVVEAHEAVNCNNKQTLFVRLLNVWLQTGVLRESAPVGHLNRKAAHHRRRRPFLLGQVCRARFHLSSRAVRCRSAANTG